MSKKYLVLGGPVYSKSDLQYHYLSPTTLVRLYKVPPSECILGDIDNAERVLMGIPPAMRSRLIRLIPRCDGNYTLDAAKRRRIFPESIDPALTGVGTDV